MRLLILSLILSLFLSQAFSATIVAHKGLTNSFAFESAGCHARSLTSIDHYYIENTIPSILESYRLGADVVEVDFRLSKDRELILFQMEELDCQTNGKGLVRNTSISDLKKIRADWNLSADGGKTYPWRGRRPVYIPSLDDLLKVNGCRPLMLNPKDKHPEEARVLVEKLKPLNCDWSKFSYWGSVDTYQYLKKNLPDFGPFIPNPYFMHLCMEAYKGLGAFGIWPEVCRKEVMQIDVRSLSWDLWGWPFDFVSLARKNGSKVWVYGVNTNELLRIYYPHVDAIITSLLYRALDVTPAQAP